MSWTGGWVKQENMNNSNLLDVSLASSGCIRPSATKKGQPCPCDIQLSYYKLKTLMKFRQVVSIFFDTFRKFSQFLLDFYEIYKLLRKPLDKSQGDVCVMCWTLLDTKQFHHDQTQCIDKHSLLTTNLSTEWPTNYKDSDKAQESTSLRIQR